MKDKETFVQDRYHESEGTNSQKEIGNRDDLDSKLNTDFSSRNSEDLTNDESADIDPNKVANKPKFKSENHE